MSSLSALFATSKRAVRNNIIEPVQECISAARLRRFVRAFRNGAPINLDMVRTVRRAWGNEGYSASVGYVGVVLDRVAQCRGSVLECGTGLTTLVSALAGERNGWSVWSLEQDAEWGHFVEARLRANGINNVHIVIAPLKSKSNYAWYDLEGVELPTHFELVVCDGPAIAEHWRDAYPRFRYGLVPELAARGITFDSILLDDATDPRAPLMLAAWKEEFGLTGTMKQYGPDDACAEFRPPARSPG